MNLRPLHDRLVVRRTEEDNMSAGGIVIPDVAAEKPSRGEIIAVGSGAINSDGSIRELSVKVGDLVVFGKFAGTEIKIGNEDLIVMSENDIMAIVE